MQQVGFLNKYFLKIFICQEFIPYTHSWESQEWADGGDGWNVYLYTDYGSKVVMHRFNISAPVEAGRVLNVDFNIDHGTGTSEMGTLVEIDTDWRPGNDYEVDM